MEMSYREMVVHILFDLGLLLLVAGVILSAWLGAASALLGVVLGSICVLLSMSLTSLFD